MARDDQLVLVGGVLAGAAGVAAGIWGWAGRTSNARRFGSGAGPPGWHWPAGFPLGLLPGSGFMVLVGSLLTLLGRDQDATPMIVNLVAGFALLLGLAVATAGLIGVIPRWYREQSARDTRGSLNILTFAALWATAAKKPRVLSARQAQKEVRRRFGRSRAVAFWSTGYVYDPDTDQRAHAFARPGTVDGILTLYPTALAFAASLPEDVLRNEATTIVLSHDEIAGARVVPARAGADGRPRKGWLYRSFHLRVVVDTREGSYVFEVAERRARLVAERINRRSRGSLFDEIH